MKPGAARLELLAKIYKDFPEVPPGKAEKVLDEVLKAARRGDFSRSTASLSEQRELSITVEYGEEVDYREGIRDYESDDFTTTLLGVSEVVAPPRLAQFILLLIPLSQRDQLMGDLEEEYRTVVLPKYPKLAKLYYWWHALTEVACAVTNGLKGVVLDWVFSKFTT